MSPIVGASDVTPDEGNVRVNGGIAMEEDATAHDPAAHARLLALVQGWTDGGEIDIDDLDGIPDVKTGVINQLNWLKVVKESTTELRKMSKEQKAKGKSLPRSTIGKVRAMNKDAKTCVLVVIKGKTIPSHCDRNKRPTKRFPVFRDVNRKPHGDDCCCMTAEYMESLQNNVLKTLNGIPHGWFFVPATNGDTSQGFCPQSGSIMQVFGLMSFFGITTCIFYADDTCNGMTAPILPGTYSTIGDAHYQVMFEDSDGTLKQEDLRGCQAVLNIVNHLMTSRFANWKAIMAGLFDNVKKTACGQGAIIVTNVYRAMNLATGEVRITADASQTALNNVKAFGAYGSSIALQAILHTCCKVGYSMSVAQSSFHIANFLFPRKTSSLFPDYMPLPSGCDPIIVGIGLNTPLCLEAMKEICTNTVRIADLSKVPTNTDEALQYLLGNLPTDVRDEMISSGQGDSGSKFALALEEHLKACTLIIDQARKGIFCLPAVNPCRTSDFQPNTRKVVFSKLLAEVGSDAALRMSRYFNSDKPITMLEGYKRGLNKRDFFKVEDVLRGSFINIGELEKRREITRYVGTHDGYNADTQPTINPASWKIDYSLGGPTIDPNSIFMDAVYDRSAPNNGAATSRLIVKSRVPTYKFASVSSLDEIVIKETDVSSKFGNEYTFVVRLYKIPATTHPVISMTFITDKIKIGDPAAFTWVPHISGVGRDIETGHLDVRQPTSINSSGFNVPNAMWSRVAAKCLSALGFQVTELRHGLMDVPAGSQQLRYYARIADVRPSEFFVACFHIPVVAQLKTRRTELLALCTEIAKHSDEISLCYCTSADATQTTNPAVDTDTIGTGELNAEDSFLSQVTHGSYVRLTTSKTWYKAFSDHRDILPILFFLGIRLSGAAASRSKPSAHSVSLGPDGLIETAGIATGGGRHTVTYSCDPISDRYSITCNGAQIGGSFNTAELGVVADAMIAAYLNSVQQNTVINDKSRN